jgi:hypothetical protein
MSDELTTPIEGQKTDTSTIILIFLAVVLIFMCCCCSLLLIIGWYIGDYVVDWFRIVSLVGSLLLT